jgi:2-polyprenyl-3-methyl-5-hydroxy-6-metoxy-1,4-benzoquinol methylase
MSWDTLTVAPCGTHHLMEGRPAYKDQFDEVLKFHPPGLAPVQRDGVAWHIHANGTPAYAARFKRTFGFYEGLASVIDAQGALHIDAQGVPVHPQRYAWCGNFQGGRCAVRTTSGAYLHITLDGEPAYPERWRYVGDFRDGMAVVQADDGQSTHIDTHGAIVHGAWFDDLDVFHKGYARARDARGWMHIDIKGVPVYERRFASVEPFYNRQSRVETPGGGLEIIDERGLTVHVLREPHRSAFSELSADMVGFWRTQTISAAVALGLFEALPASAAELSTTMLMQHDRLLRLLRALGELNLVQETFGEWSVTERGAYLLEDHPMTLAHAALEFGNDFPAMWAHLPMALRNGDAWSPPDIFGALAADPRRGKLHHQMLRSYARHDYPLVPSAMDLCGAEHVIDVGGGLGELAERLVGFYPALKLTVLDRPEVIEQSRQSQSDGGKVNWRSGDFFDAWDMDADVVVLARVLHDWNDEDTLRILARARGSLRAGGRIFVVEMVLPESSFAGGLCDLHLLMATGGQERTLAQYAELMAQSGFILRKHVRVTALTSVLMGEAS